jgi:hypothetical protein
VPYDSLGLNHDISLKEYQYQLSRLRLGISSIVPSILFRTSVLSRSLSHSIKYRINWSIAPSSLTTPVGLYPHACPKRAGDFQIKL